MVNEDSIVLKKLSERAQEAMKDPNIPKIYANGFIISIGSSDIVMSCLLNGEAFQVMNMSYTSAKSLRDALDITIQRFEEKTGTKLLTITEIKKAVTEPETPTP